LRADNVLRFGHAPIMELDLILLRGLNCSVYGATASKNAVQRNTTSKPDYKTPRQKPDQYESFELLHFMVT
jgi:hypothetical protein